MTRVTRSTSTPRRAHLSQRELQAHPRINFRVDEILGELIERYAQTQQPIGVSFRELVHWLPSGERATHFIHPYPAKLLAHIPHLFLTNSLLSQPGDTVLDPFCGSGTVLLEAVLAERHALGVDANPLARLIAQVKVRRISENRLRAALALLLKQMSLQGAVRAPVVVNREYWFYPHIADQLARLAFAVEKIRNIDVRDFFRVCLSSCVRRVSLADPRLSVPVRLRRSQYPRKHWLYEKTIRRLNRLRRINVASAFVEIVEANIRRMQAFYALSLCGESNISGVVVGSDARDLRDERGLIGPVGRRLRAGSVDLIITSPPYLGAQKYIRASSLSLGWLNLVGNRTLREIEDENIGREHFPVETYVKSLQTGMPEADAVISRIREQSPLRAHIAATYLIEMCAAIEECVRILKPGGYFVLVAANNRVCGAEFHTQEYLQSIAKRQDLALRLRLSDAIKARGLMTRRNTTSGLIESESVFLFQKPVRLRRSER